MSFSALLTHPALVDLQQVLGDDHIRLVGGCVRDTLAGNETRDLDLCTPLLPEDVLAKVAASPAFKAIPTGLQHGTLTAHHLATKQSLEITTLRVDQETDGRHATVAFTADWQGDAARRDFTFNAMMVDMAGGLHDYFGGQADLAAGQVRFIGKAQDRLAEDWLRGLRYFRFWGRYGVALPDEETAQALRLGSENLANLSVERVWSELKGLIKTPRALPLFRELGYVDALGLELQTVEPREDSVASWALSLGPRNDGVLKSFKASKAEQDWFSAIRAAKASQVPVFERQVRFGHQATQVALGQTLAPPPPFPVRAQDLVDLGHPPGPKIGALMRKLQDRWIASEGQLDRDALIKSIT